MTRPDPDRFETFIDVRAPRSRVWRAISDPAELGAWFGMGEALTLIGDFVPGARIDGRWHVDGRDLIERFCVIEAIEPERRLSFHWVPYEVPEGEDHDAHPQTRIEITLDDVEGGTRVIVVESGFAKLPPDKQYKRDQNQEGWAMQLQAIAVHLHGRVDVSVAYRIARSPAEVFDVIADPARLDRLLTARASRRVVYQVPGQKVVFVWAATGPRTKVTLSLAPDGDGTRLTASEAPFPRTEEGVARALAETQAWTDFCLCLKADLEHGVSLSCRAS